MRILSITTLFVCLLSLSSIQSHAQELNCRVSINHSQIQGTNTQIFQTLENSLKEFINERKWTNAHYSIIERISCNFSIVVKEYSDDGTFKCELTVQSSRPVFNSNYNTTLLNIKDNSFEFQYMEYDPLEFRDDAIDNNLTAVIAYYAYLIIGIDLDSMGPMGGTEVLRKAENIVNAAQTFGEPGWKAFDDSKNRHAIINDYLSEYMSPIRQFMYDYHRTGLDEMSQNAERGRATIATSLEQLKQAKENQPMSALPEIILEAKKDELLNIFSKGPQQERENVYEILTSISPADINDWEKIKQNAQ